jgi:hypothetical protein
MMFEIKSINDKWISKSKSSLASFLHPKVNAKGKPPKPNPQMFSVLYKSIAKIEDFSHYGRSFCRCSLSFLLFSFLTPATLS